MAGLSHGGIFTVEIFWQFEAAPKLYRPDELSWEFSANWCIAVWGGFLAELSGLEWIRLGDLSDDVAWTSLSISPQHQQSSHAVMLPLHTGSCDTLQSRTRCKKLTSHTVKMRCLKFYTLAQASLEFLIELWHVAAQVTFRSANFKIKFCHKVKYFADGQCYWLSEQPWLI